MKKLLKIILNYSSQKFDANWTIGQYSPVETAWRNSSSYPFAIQVMMALTDTAHYFAEGASVNKVVYDLTLNQFINNLRGFAVFILYH